MSSAPLTYSSTTPGSADRPDRPGKSRSGTGGDPGILAIGLGEAALTSSAPADSAQGRLQDWGHQETAAGRGAQPHQIAELLLRIATGEADRLSGRHLSVHDDLDMLLNRVEDVLRDDLDVLRLYGLPKANLSASTGTCVNSCPDALPTGPE
ncbi:MAG TPA: hypothetical protein VE155_00570 [Pseudonocardiaceae bacterium]|nr:hypothetical protein [Pseudonocardiaceae bacterium]